MALTKYSDFLSASKPTLITYCSVRGMSTSGNTKTELVAKAFTAMEMKQQRHGGAEAFLHDIVNNLYAEGE